MDPNTFSDNYCWFVIEACSVCRNSKASFTTTKKNLTVNIKIYLYFRKGPKAFWALLT